MAQALTIKNANTSIKTVGDMLPRFYEDDYKFTQGALLEYDVLKIAGTAQEVQEKFNAIRVRIERAYKMPSSLWSRTPPEEKEVWLDADDKWYWLEFAPKYKRSVSLLSAGELTVLETATTGLERDIIYQKMIVNPGEWDNNNIIEATDLNRVAMEL